MKIGLCLAALALALTVQVSAQEKTPEPSKATEQEKKLATLKVPEELKEKAPEKFQVKFETTQGDFIVDVTREWAPRGADRFYNLVKNGYFDGVKFFRVVPNFVVQFGIHGEPDVAKKWDNATIMDDIVTESNKRGYLTFAMAGPNTRTTQLFINLADNKFLDQSGFSPFAKVSKGMEIVDKLYSGYREKITQLQGEIVTGGNKYLEKEWPKLDGIKKAALVEAKPKSDPAPKSANPAP